MVQFYTLALACVVGYVAAAGTCCSQKKVGTETYILTGEEDTSGFGCISGCVYQKENMPESRFCFARGTQEAVCVNTNPFCHTCLKENAPQCHGPCGFGDDDKSKCIERGGVCYSDNDAVPDGYEATDVPCDKASTCHLKLYERCFGPYGNLPTARFSFTDKYTAELNGIVTKIKIYTGDYSATKDIITGVQLTYGTATGPLHGGTGYGTPTTCEPIPGQFFGGTFGSARTMGNFQSFIYQLGFTGTTATNILCDTGDSNEVLPVFGIYAPPNTSYRLAYVYGTEIRGANAMLGGLTFCFNAIVG